VLVARVLVPRERLERWLENFETRHGTTQLSLTGGRLAGRAEDGSTFDAEAPFGREVTEPTLAALLDATMPPDDWGILLVRKGGFAVARLARERVVESKVGQRHVQGRTKAGGQSQQRFARRRDNQARAAYEAAAEHAARIVARVPVLVVGGDRSAVDVVLEDPRLRDPASGVRGTFLTVPDPRRGVLEQAIRDACSVRIDVTNA
jgi:peptide subunit release factor 1 (eRF1)